KYDGGIIYGANDFVTLPQPLIDTLSSLGFTTFIDDIISSGLKKKLSDTPAVTVFTFANSSKTFSIDINEYTITGFLGYSPKLVDQRSLKNNAGKTLTFKYKHGSLFVNDTRVVRSDITSKNGVVHQLEKVSCSPCEQSEHG
ncbi:FAS1 domain-containing protein, partial [Trichophaea hybrida]